MSVRNPTGSIGDFIDDMTVQPTHMGGARDISLGKFNTSWVTVSALLKLPEQYWILASVAHHFEGAARLDSEVVGHA